MPAHGPGWKPQPTGKRVKKNPRWWTSPPKVVKKTQNRENPPSPVTWSEPPPLRGELPPPSLGENHPVSGFNNLWAESSLWAESCTTSTHTSP